MRRTLAVLLAGLALATTGCLRATTVAVVNENGSGSVDIVAAVDPGALPGDGPGGLASLIAGGLGDLTSLNDLSNAEICQRFEDETAPTEDELPDGAEVLDYNADGFCGHEVRHEFASPDELIAVFQAASIGEPAPASEFVVAPDADGGWRFEAPITADPRTAAELPSTARDLVANADNLVTYEVTLPGEPGDHNADTVDGSTFTWDIDLGTAPDRLIATTIPAPSPTSNLILPAVIAAIGAAVAIAAVLLVARRQRRPATAAWATADRPGPGLGPDLDLTAATSQPSYAEASPAAAQPIGGAEPGAAAVEPRWDPARDAWVADHPTEGLLVHDDETGQWHRATLGG